MVTVDSVGRAPVMRGRVAVDRFDGGVSGRAWSAVFAPGWRGANGVVAGGCGAWSGGSGQQAAPSPCGPRWRHPADRVAGDQIAGQRLDPQALGERRDQRDPSVRNDPLVMESDLQRVQSDRLVILHHGGSGVSPVSRVR